MEKLIALLRSIWTNLGLSFKLLLAFCYPFFVVAVFGFFLVPFKLEFLKEAIGFACLTTFFIGFYLLAKTNFRGFVFCFSVVLLSILAFIKLSFYQLYGVKLSASALFVIFETNANETSEFIANYLNFHIAFLFLVLFIPIIWAVFKNKKLIGKESAPKSYIQILISLVLLIGSGFAMQWKFSNENILLSGYQSYLEYINTKEILKSQLATKKNALVADAINNEEEATYVVIIGESTSSWHMQLYGYERETNPRLSEIKDELVVFKNIISPNVHTILALEKILTFSNFENTGLEENASVVQLANAAGFETYWISNQQPVGIHESLSTTIANAAKNKHFIATEGYKYTIHDEALMPILEDVLQEKKKKKMIFLHLIGTHVGYYKRYPKKFNVFNTNSKKEKGEKANRYINEYDNAVRYNDSIVRAIIDKVKKVNTNSYVAYFSDHGDDVYDVEDMAGHNEYLGTKPMYDVPFIAWFSEKYKNRRSSFKVTDSIQNRKYNLEDFIYSLAELSNIRFQKMDSTRSVFSQNFVERPRLIKNGVDYDKE